MATNTNLKRLPTKYIRDRSKSAYEKQDHCYVCGCEEDLELHHLFSIDALFKIWCKLNSLVIKTTDDILGCRDQFIEEHRVEIYDEVRTLCNKHHKLLHRVYQQKPLLSTGPKQKRWLDKQRSKFIGE